MAITKVIYQDSCEALVKAAAANGEMMCSLIETEHGVKSASSALVSRELLEKYRPTDDNTACIHLIAMGNSDQYGFNRNGDYFAGDVLEKKASTFVTHGKVFREHRHYEDRRRGQYEPIGQVKWAGYDPKGMQRVELIVHLDKNAAAEEYEMAKKGEDLSWSMSCRVPNDRCSCCGNQAKTVSNYCEHLKHKMGQYIDGMSKYAFAYNDNPTFFDISRVGTPADRIARHLEYMFKSPDAELQKSAGMVKAASSRDVCIPSAYAAMADGINLEVLELEEQAMLTKLASIEEFANAQETRSRAAHDSRAYAMLVTNPMVLTEKMAAAELEACRAVEPGTLFRELSKRACILSFPAFCQYVFGKEDVEDMPIVKRATMCLPGIFTDMLPRIMTMAPCTSIFTPSSEFMAERDPKRGDLVQNVMDSMENKFSMKQAPMTQRVTTIVIRCSAPKVVCRMQKSAAVANDEFENAAQQLAEAYGQYQIRALCDMENWYGDQVHNICDSVVGSNAGIMFDNF